MSRRRRREDYRYIPGGPRGPLTDRHGCVVYAAQRLRDVVAVCRQTWPAATDVSIYRLRDSRCIRLLLPLRGSEETK